MTGGRRGGGGLRATIHEAGRQLGVPQGFTLSVAGTLAALVGQRGSGPWPAWLFVAGGGLGFCTVLLAVGAYHDGAPRTPGRLRGRAAFTLLPVVVVPAALLGTAWIEADTLAFFVAGAVVVVAYVVLLGALAWLTSPGDDDGPPVRPPAPWWRRGRVPSVGRRRHPDSDRSSP